MAKIAKFPLSGRRWSIGRNRVTEPGCPKLSYLGGRYEEADAAVAEELKAA